MATLKDNEDDVVPSGAETVDLPEDEKVEPVNIIEEDERLTDDDRALDADEDEDSPEGRKKRESARDRRLRAKQAKQRDKDELAILRATVAKQNDRLNAAEKALIETQVAELESRASTAQNYVSQWNEIEIKATGAKNTQDALAARQYREQAAAEAARFSQGAAELKRKLGETAAKPQGQPSFTPLALNFLSDKPWYNANGGDKDSLIVQALDKALMAQGKNPNTTDYWNELNQEVRKALPHKFDADEGDDVDDDPEEERPTEAPKRKGPPTGGSSRTSVSNSGKEIRLPREYVEALKEAGKWDDPKVRARMAKRYAEQQRTSRG